MLNVSGVLLDGYNLTITFKDCRLHNGKQIFTSVSILDEIGASLTHGYQSREDSVVLFEQRVCSVVGEVINSGSLTCFDNTLPVYSGSLVHLHFYV